MKRKLELLKQAARQAMESESNPITAEFFSRNLGKIILVLFILYSYVQMRYTYEEAISQIGTLKTQLADVRYTSIATWGELTSKNKPENVKSRISDDAKLIAADEPPIQVK